MTAQQRQEFCVRWNSHLGSIGAAFPQLLAGQRFVDVTLACEGHQVHCHRLVLAACSSYFESILAENPCKHPVIILPSEIKLWEIQALVDFMYKGEVNVTQAGLPNLLRCAEQLRIRGLYGSDAALNLNQLKALSNKVTSSSVANAAAVSSAAVAAASANNTNDSTETDNDSATTTTNTTAASGATMRHAANNDSSLDVKKQFQLQTQQLLQQQQQQQQQNGSITAAQHQQQLIHLQQQQHNNLQLQQQQQINAMLKQQETTNASNATEDESADESTSNAYENEEEYIDKPTKMECTIEEESFVGHDEDSFGGVETEHEMSGGGVGGSNGSMGNISVVNAAMLQNSMDGGSAYKRIRRSEASLAQAAKCVSKGQTFQTVSNMFSIPVSTIRFYMARKGILPKRKRGRGASSAASGATLSSAVMSQALAQMKRSGSPILEPPYHLLGSSYKMPEQQGATTNII